MFVSEAASFYVHHRYPTYQQHSLFFTAKTTDLELVCCLLRVSALSFPAATVRRKHEVSEKIYLVEYIGLLVSQILQSTNISLEEHLPALFVLFMFELQGRVLPPEIRVQSEETGSKAISSSRGSQEALSLLQFAIVKVLNRYIGIQEPLTAHVFSGVVRNFVRSRSVSYSSQPRFCFAQLIPLQT